LKLCAALTRLRPFNVQILGAFQHLYSHVVNRPDAISAATDLSILLATTHLLGRESSPSANYDISNLLARMCDEASAQIQKTIPLIVPDERPQMESEAKVSDLQGHPFDGLVAQRENGKLDGFAPYDPILGFVPNFFADFDVISGTFQ
jgi:hypothetical protein